MSPVEFATAGSGLVCAKALDCLGALVRGQEAGGRYVAVEFPVGEGGGDYGYQADEEEDAVLIALVEWSDIGLVGLDVHLPWGKLV